MKGNIFQQEINIQVPDNVFDIGYRNDFTCAIGSLVPICWYDALPGDRVPLAHTINVQTLAMRAPAFANLRVYCADFAVPYRLLCTHWPEFISPETPAQDDTYLHPYFTVKTPLTAGSLGDYLGLPIGVPISKHLTAFPVRAYYQIFNEWFRDEHSMEKVDVSLDDGVDDYAAQAVAGLPLQVCWAKDYFTSCLPNAQFGDGAVANLNGDDSGVEIAEIRRANALQRWLERAYVFGTRYIESIFGHFGVKSNDARLQRPQLIGYNSAPLRIDTILQTSQNANEETPTGTRYGTMNGSAQFTLDDGIFECEEHMIVMSLMFIRPEADYVQGLSREWTRTDRFDYAWPEFANIGEQEVLNGELHYTNTNTDDQTFGYQSRYAEYKFHRNEVHGQFLTSLNHWTMARLFDGNPELNRHFLQISRSADDSLFPVSAAQVDHYLVGVTNYCEAGRKLPAFGMPTL